MEWIYTATRLTHLINILNNDNTAVRELASSLLLDLRRRKVLVATDNQDSLARHTIGQA